MDAPAPRRNLVWAVVGALLLAGVLIALLVTTARTQRRLAVIRACRHCSVAGKPVESGWIEVQSGDAWSISLGNNAGMVVRGPARFEVAGTGRVALSQGLVFTTSGVGGRAVVLMPRNLSAEIEGASVGTEGADSRIGLRATAEGNRVEVLGGGAVLELRDGPKRLANNQSWQSGRAEAIGQPTEDEAHWLVELAGKP